MRLRSMIGLAVLGALLAAPAQALREGQVEGVWRKSMGGTCEQPFLRTGDLGESPRGEIALRTVIDNAGTVIEGDLVVRGQRQGQLVDPETDRALFLVDLPGGGPNIRVIPMALDYRDWGETVLEMCE